MKLLECEHSMAVWPVIRMLQVRHRSVLMANHGRADCGQPSSLVSDLIQLTVN